MTAGRRADSEPVKSAELAGHETPEGGGAATDGTARRVRARMTLRIPDDEVTRPNVPVDGDGEAAPAMITATRIITINPPASDERIPVVEGRDSVPPQAPTSDVVASRGSVSDAVHEDSWTPYQPQAADFPRMPSSEDIPVTISQPDSAEVLEVEDLASRARALEEPVRTVPPVEIAPPRSEGRAAALPPEPSMDDDDAYTRSPRLSEPSDAPEIAVEDLVSIESVPIDKHPSDSSFEALSIPPPPAPPSNATGNPIHAQRVTPSGSRSGLLAATSSPLSPPPMNETAASRKRTRPWWEELFNDDYLRTMAKLTDEQIAAEASFIEESLGVARGAMVLDLACGTGRHAIELTRRGYQVVGFDLSLAMLARAAEEAQDRRQKLNFLQGDMREMTFEDTFDGVYCWNTSFGFFEEEKNAQVVGRVHRALRKGGQFVLEVINRDFAIQQAPSLAWFEGDGCICMDEMQIDWITSRMRTKRTMMFDDGRTKEIEYGIRIYSLHELGRLLNDQGFRVVEVSGRVGTPGVFFGAESPRTMILAEKR